MLTKTKGIVIRTIKYGDSSAITKILTAEFGLIGFHVPGLFKNKGAIKPSHLQALNCIEFSFNHNTTKNLFNIRELNCIHHFNSSHFTRQAFYNVMVEMVSQTIRENEQNRSLFEFLFNDMIPELNEINNYWQLPTAMLHVLYHYGCAPNTESYCEGALLDLENGIFSERLRQMKYTATPEVSHVIYNILDHGSVHLEENSTLRHQTIEALIDYFKLHVNENFDLKSREVLWQVMKG